MLQAKHKKKSMSQVLYLSHSVIYLQYLPFFCLKTLDYFSYNLFKLLHCCYKILVYNLSPINFNILKDNFCCHWLFSSCLIPLVSCNFWHIYPFPWSQHIFSISLISPPNSYAWLVCDARACVCVCAQLLPGQPGRGNQKRSACTIYIPYAQASRLWNDAFFFGVAKYSIDHKGKIKSQL